MKQTVSKSDFRDAFRRCGRGHQFSYEGLSVLFDYLIDYEDNCDMELELDPIACCCNFTEYDNLAEFQADYSTDYETIEDIENQTTVLRVGNDGFIIQCF